MKRKQLQHSLWFGEQFQQLHQSGLSFQAALRILHDTAPDATWRSQIQRIANAIQKGRSFAQALARCPEYFDVNYRALIKIGEETGHLSQVLLSLTDHQRLQLSLRAKLSSALIYPLLTLALMGVMLLIMFIEVIPHFQAIFAQFHAPLPRLTRMLFDTAHLLQTRGWVIFLCIFLLSVGLKKAKLKQIDWFKTQPQLFRVPLLGSCYQEALLMFFFKTTGFSLGAGLSLLQVFTLLETRYARTPFARLFPHLKYAVTQGASLHKVFDHPAYFPPICRALLEVAEASGSLDLQCEQLGRYFQARLEAKIERIKFLLEPLLLLITGLIVGGVVLALYQPLFSLGSLV